MSLVKYRIKEVAADFGVAPKEISQIVEKYSEKPKSPSQILTEEELNVVFDYMTQHNQISSLEAVFAVLAIEHGIVPPTINHAEGDEDPEIDYGMNFTFNKAQKRDVKVALSNTFGFGGHNASVAFKKIED